MEQVTRGDPLPRFPDARNDRKLLGTCNVTHYGHKVFEGTGWLEM